MKMQLDQLLERVINFLAQENANWIQGEGLDYILYGPVGVSGFDGDFYLIGGSPKAEFYSAISTIYQLTLLRVRTSIHASASPYVHTRLLDFLSCVNCTSMRKPELTRAVQHRAKRQASIDSPTL